MSIELCVKALLVASGSSWRGKKVGPFLRSGPGEMMFCDLNNGYESC